MDSSLKSSYASEKHVEEMKEDVEQASEDYPLEFVRKTIRQVDFRMLPFLGLLYSVALIDRANLGIARVAGMNEDLGMDLGNRYSVASCLYFVPYILLQLPSGFSSIFAYALTLLAPRGGLDGWQWIFAIEGIITVVLGVLTFLFIPDFPDKNTFLTEEQTKMVLDRVEKDRGDSLPDKMTWAKIILHFSDWTTWAFALMFMCATMPAYAVGFFITIILSSMGYGVRDSLLLSAPPGVFAAACCFGFAYISDRTRKRALLISIQTLVTTIGLFLTAYAKNNGVRYFGHLSDDNQAANNVVSHSKRSVSTAAIVAFGGIGGIFATTV
ncbi:hypothetical protein H0H92_009937 [Tricholoma furcatifolium]|nr:hypothetical protein H0H92_009937 [Tricholoma furcatifolium]